MGLFNPEPKRNTDLNSLEPYVAERVRRILKRMDARGYDPVVFEARSAGACVTPQSGATSTQ